MLHSCRPPQPGDGAAQGLLDYWTPIRTLTFHGPGSDHPAARETQAHLPSASVVGRVHPRRGARKEVTHTRACITHNTHVHTGVHHTYTGVHHTPHTRTHRRASYTIYMYTQVCVTLHTHIHRCASHHAHLHTQACITSHTHRCASHATHIHTGVRHTPHVHTGVHHTMHTYTGVHHTSHVCITDHTHECSYVHRSGCALHTQAYTPHACTHVPPLGSCVDYVTGKGSTRGDGAGS